MGEPSTAPGRVEGGGQPVLSFEQCFILFCSFPLIFAFVVGGLGFEFCGVVAGWRHALRSEWPFIIIIIYHHMGARVGQWGLWLLLRQPPLVTVYAFSHVK